MALNPQVVELLAVIESFGDPPIEESTPEEVRAGMTARQIPSMQEVHEVRAVDAGGIPARLYRPSDRPGLGLLVFFHGGGWVIGDLDTHDDVTRRLAAASGCAVLSIDYRLAPEHPFPAGVEDALAAASWAAANAEALGCDPARLAIGGDSAGGNLAAVVAQANPGLFRFQLLIYPAVDATGRTASYEEFRDGPFLTAAGMKWFLDHYLSGGGSTEDTRVSPALAAEPALAASPPTLVITAECDPLRDEGEAYARRLESLGVPTMVKRYDGMIHAFVSFADFLDDGQAALEEAGAALAAALGA